MHHRFVVFFPTYCRLVYNNKHHPSVFFVFTFAKKNSYAIRILIVQIVSGLCCFEKSQKNKNK